LKIEDGFQQMSRPEIGPDVGHVISEQAICHSRKLLIRISLVRIMRSGPGVKVLACPVP
jgi:hypothetical protein